MAYEWPGNVRELEGVILRALVLTTSATLQPEDINLPQQSPKPTQENTLLRQAKTSMIQLRAKLLNQTARGAPR